LADGEEITLHPLPECVLGATTPAPARAPRCPARHEDRVKRFETDRILKALSDSGNLREAAQRVDMPLRTLHYRMKKLRIEKRFIRLVDLD
jgi:transcriptional regulator with GAF, ATPase, and Fis domain